MFAIAAFAQLAFEQFPAEPFVVPIAADIGDVMYAPRWRKGWW